MGSLIPESEALEFESAAHGESHTWRATREFALLGEILESVEWGALDLLMFDLPPGAERTVQYADFLGPRTSFLLVTIPSEVSRGRGRALGGGPVERTQSHPRLRREHERLLLPRLQRDQAALCRARLTVSHPRRRRRQPPALPSRASGPFHSIPSLRGICDTGILSAELPESAVSRALEHVAQQLLDTSNRQRPPPLRFE
jgi:hypothetical protein